LDSDQFWVTAATSNRSAVQVDDQTSNRFSVAAVTVASEPSRPMFGKER